MNKIKIMAIVVYVIMMAGLVIIVSGCSGSKVKHSSQKTDPGSKNNPPIVCRGELEDQMTTILSDLLTDTDFSLYLEAEDGCSFTFSRGSSTLSTSYASASTSKWVTAVIILRLVDQGLLSLNNAF
jgi:hypothetical protein